MKKTGLKSALCGITIAAIMLFSPKVSATSTTAVMDSNSKVLKEGETYTITLNINNIDVGEGIKGITGTLSYDTNVFEEITDDSLSSTTDWKVPDYDSKPLMIITSKSNKFVKNDTVALKMTVKAKGTVDVDSTTISFKNIIVSDGAASEGGHGDIKVPEASVTLTKEGTPTPTPTAIPTQEPTPTEATTPTQTPTSNGTTTPTATPTATAKTTGVLPKAGINVIIMEVVAVVILAGIIFYARYTKLKKSEK